MGKPGRKALPKWRIKQVRFRNRTASTRERYHIECIENGRAKSHYAYTPDQCEKRVDELLAEYAKHDDHSKERPDIPAWPQYETAIDIQELTEGADENPLAAQLKRNPEMRVLQTAMDLAAKRGDVGQVIRCVKEMRDHQASLIKMGIVSLPKKEEATDHELDKIRQMSDRELCELAVKLSREISEAEGVALKLVKTSS